MSRFYDFENANLIKAPYVIIDGQEYEVHPAEYEGNPLTAGQLNEMQDNINIVKINKTINVETAGTDLNDYIETGSWFFNNANTPSNKPSNVEVQSGYLEVVRRNTGDVLQRWTETNKKTVWQRQKVAGTWQSWFVLGKEKSCATISLNANTDITVTTSYQDKLVSLNSIELNRGSLFSVTNGKIKANRDCTVKVSSQSTMRASQDMTKILRVLKNNTSIILQGYMFSSANTYTCIGLTPKIINLNADDYLSLTISCNQNNATINLAGTAYTYLTVEEIV